MSSASLSPESTRPWSWRGHDRVMQQQVWGVLFSSVSYVLYSGISLVQVAFGLMTLNVAVALAVGSLAVNGLFYAWIRSGRARRSRDPGLGRAQLIIGVLFMYAAYAATGPAAISMTIIMASHVVYAMFSMKPRDVWRLVIAVLAGLAIVMLACHLTWPDRYRADLQVVAWLYASLVVPMIAMLADRVTAMTQKLKSQRTELETALKQVRELATRDELTRTHNRAHMTELLALQLAQHRRTQAPMCVALIDIDHFKQVNDHHGHATGDEVLRRFASRALGQLREGDVLARWGGEEFLVLLPHTARADAMLALQRFQRALADDTGLPEDQAMPEGLRISFSAGITQVGADDSLDRAIERADQAMYRAKNAGRARCEAG